MIELFEGVGILFPNVLFQLVTFLLFVYIMYRLLYNPLRQTMQQRREKIRGSLEEATLMQEQAREERRSFEQSLRQQREEARRTRDEALQRVSVIEQEELKRARADADRIRQDAERDAERLKNQALREARGQLADLVVHATAKVLDRAIDDPEHRRLVGDVVTEVEDRQA
jgi:F-type H+-transporting ATPase subunit b